MCVQKTWKHIKIYVLETLQKVQSIMVYSLYNSVFLFINSFYNLFISDQKKDRTEMQKKKEV